ncbi:MAG TPA: recombinase family protein [Phycisphaerae bacterium]|nr:recombinase family protein [Phycisphaerae bacterium]HPU31099.1 recombinase family protein [Phycisphaerae bacterium]
MRYRTKVRSSTKSGKQRGGKPWTQRSVYEVLINRKYTGQMVHKGKVYPGEHEAIVSVEQFERVQKLLSANQTYTHKHQVRRFVLLRRMIRCGECGGRVQPSWTRKDGREYRYYACRKKIKEGYGQCPLPNLPAGEIETVVVDQLRALLRHPDVIARTYREICRTAGTGPDKAALARLEELRLRREQTQKSIRALLSVADQDGGFLAEELKRLSAELKSLDQAIRDLEATSTRGAVVELDRVSQALRAIDPIWNVLLAEEQRRIAQLLIEEIVVSTRGIDIRFRTNGIEQIVAELQPIEERHA